MAQFFLSPASVAWLIYVAGFAAVFLLCWSFGLWRGIDRREIVGCLSVWQLIAAGLYWLVVASQAEPPAAGWFMVIAIITLQLLAFAAVVSILHASRRMLDGSIDPEPEPQRQY